MQSLLHHAGYPTNGSRTTHHLEVETSVEGWAARTPSTFTSRRLLSGTSGHLSPLVSRSARRVDRVARGDRGGQRRRSRSDTAALRRRASRSSIGRFETPGVRRVRHRWHANVTRSKKPRRSDARRSQPLRAPTYASSVPAIEACDEERRVDARTASTAPRSRRSCGLGVARERDRSSAMALPPAGADRSSLLSGDLGSQSGPRRCGHAS